MHNLTLVIGDKSFSSWSLRPWLALKVTGTPFTEVSIALRQADTTANILRHSPAGKVPVLKHDGVVIWDSLAICEYIAELFPDAKLLPKDRIARAVMRSACAEMHSGFVPLRTHLSMNMREQITLPDIPADAQANIERITALWHSLRQEYGQQGPYLFGHFSLADCMYAPVVSRFITYGVKVDAETQAYMNAIWDHPAMQEWYRAAQVEKIA